MRKRPTTGTAMAAAGLCLALGGMGATGAHAADLPAYVPPPPPPVWSWTGPYVGLHVGAVDGDLDGTVDVEDPIVSERVTTDPNGIMGGIQAGYNYQFDSIVLGLEGDVSFGDVDDVVYPTIVGFPARVEPEIEWMATIRGRLGWAWDRTLFYATGGVAFTDVKAKIDAGPAGSDSDKSSYFGWTVGGGVEHAVSDSISLKAEYLYADFGKEKFSFFDDYITSDDAKLTTHTFRVGVNWLF